ncbi:MAG TPA: YdeI/OmpD-associated family protein [Pyrinomonadaceae bacterium]|jgi:uncharacterized protein YdeI (YjbR/CyaY-like superfamily)|nr:YdeI/OmpD-associated family protein [Pyrinomonadaceae bacterium]
MGTRDERIDAYIAKSADFAKPILTHLRELVHKACPDVEEKIKWSCPHFDYKGPFCNMAAFKNHCAFGFWKGTLIPELKGKVEQMGQTTIGHLGQLKTLKDLPPDKVLIGYIKKAAELNDKGVKTPVRTKSGVEKKETVIPDELLAALKKNKKAMEVWKAFSPSKVREYADWIADAKTDATKNKRMADAVAWISEGKSRHWKYQTK